MMVLYVVVGETLDAPHYKMMGFKKLQFLKKSSGVPFLTVVCHNRVNPALNNRQLLESYSNNPRRSQHLRDFAQK